MLENILVTDWIEVLDVFIRALISLVTLFIVAKMLGKKQVSQLSLFDYVIGISIGNFAAEMTINLESQYMNGIVAVLIFGLVAYLVSILTMKSIFLRRFFMGTPSMLIQNGKLVHKNLVKVKMDVNDLLEVCRSCGYFDISEIEYALLEANGYLSVLPKSEHRNVTLKDIGITDKAASLCANVVIDGNFMENNIKNMNKTVPEIKKMIKKVSKDPLDDILLVTLDIHDNIKVYTKNKEIKINDVLE